MPRKNLSSQEIAQLVRKASKETLESWLHVANEQHVLFIKITNGYLCRICLEEVVRGRMDKMNLYPYAGRDSNTTSVKRHIASTHYNHPAFVDADETMRSMVTKRTEKNTILQYGVSFGTGKQQNTSSSCSFVANVFIELFIRALVATNVSVGVMLNKTVVEMLTYLCPYVKEIIPSNKVVRSLVQKTYNAKRDKIIMILKYTKFKITVMVDCWTSPNALSFMCVMVRFFIINNATKEPQLLEFVLDFIPIRRHDGKSMSDALISCLDSFSISLDKVSAVVADNASANTTLVASLNKTIVERNISNVVSAIYCFSHVMHRVITAMVSLIHEDLQTLRLLITRIRKSPGLSQDLKDIVTKRNQVHETKITSFKLVIDVKTRWSSTHEMIKKYILLSDCVSELQIHHKELRNFQINKERVKEISEFLGTLRTYQDELCKNTATLSYVLPTYNSVMDYLNRKTIYLSDLKFAMILSSDMKIVMKEAVQNEFKEAMKEKYQNKYDDIELLSSDSCLEEDSASSNFSYDSFDDTFSNLIDNVWPNQSFTNVSGMNTFKELNNQELISFLSHVGYSIIKKHYNRCSSKHTCAMILDQRLNLTYCRRNNWESIIETEVLPHLEKEFNYYKNEFPSVKEEILTTNMSKTSTTFPSFLMNKTVAVSVNNELRKYIDQPPYDPNINPIQLWHQNKSVYPILYTMAMSILCIAPTTASVERVFSDAAILIAKRRSKLSETTIREILSLRSWYKVLEDQSIFSEIFSCGNTETKRCSIPVQKENGPSKKRKCENIQNESYLTNFKEELLKSEKEFPWLDDEIIYSYATSISLQDDHVTSPLIAAMIAYETHGNSCKSAQKTLWNDIYQSANSFIPLHINNNHWACAIITGFKNSKKKSVFICDSGSGNQIECEKILNSLFPKSCDLFSISIVHVKVPIQEDTFSCGYRILHIWKNLCKSLHIGQITKTTLETISKKYNNEDMKNELISFLNK